MWKCENCGRTIYGKVVLPVHCCNSQKPSTEWPRWAKLVSLRKIDSDAGVGDTIQRYAAKIGGERFKKIAKRRGIPCGCDSRQADWNKLYPYVN